jgi:trimethylamine--corrinoid protein Co-methyltransferase
MLMEARPMNRRVSRARRAAAQPKQPAPAYVTRTVAPYELLGEDALCLIEERADDILEQIGVEVRHEPSLRLLKEAGADVNGSRVHLPRGLCRKIVTQSAPAEFMQHARNPARSVKFGGNACILAPAYGSPFVSGMDGPRHYATLNDFNNFVKLTQITPNLHYAGGVICEPTDIPVSKRHLDMVYGLIRNSDKPFMGMVTSGERAEDSMDMAKVLFGPEFVANNCVVAGLINLNSPLLLDQTMLDAAHVYARDGQATVITPFIIAGASGTTTVAGNLAQSLAETLVGMAITQLVRPGAPVVYGCMMMGMNMKTGGPIRFDETWKCVLAAGQLARRLGVPYRAGGSSSSSKVPDVQAGWEGALYMIFSLLSGVNFMLHATGTLEMGLALNYEKYVLDCDMLGAAMRMLTAIDLTEDEFGLEAIREAGPGGNFLATAHTMARYREAFYESRFCDGNSFEQWQNEGSLDAAQRATKYVKQALEEFEAPVLDPAIDEALIDFINRRKAVLPDSFA